MHPRLAVVAPPKRAGVPAACIASWARGFEASFPPGFNVTAAALRAGHADFVVWRGGAGQGMTR